MTGPSPSGSWWRCVITGKPVRLLKSKKSCLFGCEFCRISMQQQRDCRQSIKSSEHCSASPRRSSRREWRPGGHQSQRGSLGVLHSRATSRPGTCALLELPNQLLTQFSCCRFKLKDSWVPLPRDTEGCRGSSIAFQHGCPPPRFYTKMPA